MANAVTTNGPALSREVAFLSGFDSSGALAATSFATWNSDTPSTYAAQSPQFKWGGGTAGTPGGTVTYAFDPAANYSAAEQQVFLAGLALWSDEANIAFAPATSAASADVTFKRNSSGDCYESNNAIPHAVGSRVVDGPTSTVITIDTSVYGPIDQPFAYDAFPLSTVVHEEGHMLGLGHSGPYNGGTLRSADAAQLGVYDQQLYSVMSYIPPDDANAAYSSRYPVQAQFANAETPMIADILAAQRLYGAPPSTALSGGQTFGFNCTIADASQLFFDFTQNQKPVVTLFDTGRQNTLDLSGFSTDSVVNLAPGSFSSVAGLTNNVAIALGTSINRVIGGSGNDTMTGTNGTDVFVAGSGNDVMTGGGGHDLFVFRPMFGQDTIVDFSVSGPNASRLRFGASPFADMVDFLRQTTMANGSATIHAGPGSEVTLLNVSKAEIKAHPNDIVLA